MVTMFYFESCQWKKSTLRVIRVQWVRPDCNECFVCLLSCMDSGVGLSENWKPIVFRLNWGKVAQNLFQFSVGKLCKNHISRDSLDRKYYICWPSRSQKRMNHKKTSRGVGGGVISNPKNYVANFCGNKKGRRGLEDSPGKYSEFELNEYLRKIEENWQIWDMGVKKYQHCNQCL